MLNALNNELDHLLARNRFGTFFGVSQEVLDRVWSALTAADGNSVTYISMEIGADWDVYSPVRRKVLDLMARDQDAIKSPAIAPYVQSLLQGPLKIPNYGGGLGVLAGDTLKSFADCKLPVAAISLLYRSGYFSQMVDYKLGQVAWTRDWEPEKTPGLYLLVDPAHPGQPLEIEVPFYDRADQPVIAKARLWLKMEINSDLDFFVPEILLDYQTPDTPEWIKNAGRRLYDSSSEKTKAIQRRLLGAGILPAMRALGLTSRTLHLNEQHGVTVVLYLIVDQLAARFGDQYQQRATDQDILAAADQVAERIVYTIHTPVKAGHDRFAASIYQELGHSFCQRILDLLARDQEQPGVYNFTALAMRVNRATNSVSRLHKEVTRRQFPQYADKITAITNGVHHLTWISEARAGVYDAFAELHNWRHDPSAFANAGQLRENRKFRTYLEQAWSEDNLALIDYINQMLIQHRNQRLTTWIDPPNYLSYLSDREGRLEPGVFTLGFARRFSTYKRANLIFEDLDALTAILLENDWRVNFVFAGKAHPDDEPGKELIKAVLEIQDELYHQSQGLAKLVFIPGYDMAIAKMMVAGVHAWLNSPKRPLEASGTSGMKAAMNAVPNISIMDGWWVEGFHDGATGWKFGYEAPVAAEHLSEDQDALLYEEDSASFYQVLPEVLAAFYRPELRDTYLDKAIMNLTLNCPIFNTHRMAAEYLQRYQLKLPAEVTSRMRKFHRLYCSDPDGCGQSGAD